MRRRPRKDHRTVLVHFGFATPQQAAVFGVLMTGDWYQYARDSFDWLYREDVTQG